MQVFEIQSEGYLKIGVFRLPVFLLKNGRRAVSQSAVYEFLTGKPGRAGVRHSLKLSNLAKHIPTSMLIADEFAGKLEDKEIRLFFADELVLLSKAVMLASFNKHLSQTWQAALPKAQQILMAFAQDGVNSVIDHAIKNSPVVSAADFKSQLSKILDFKYF